MGTMANKRNLRINGEGDVWLIVTMEHGEHELHPKDANRQMTTVRFHYVVYQVLHSELLEVCI